MVEPVAARSMARSSLVAKQLHTGELPLISHLLAPLGEALDSGNLVQLIQVQLLLIAKEGIILHEPAPLSQILF